MAVTKVNTLDVSPAAYEELKKRLELVEHSERIREIGGKEFIDLTGILLQRETDERVQVYILFKGKKL